MTKFSSTRPPRASFEIIPCSTTLSPNSRYWTRRDDSCDAKMAIKHIRAIWRGFLTTFFIFENFILRSHNETLSLSPCFTTREARLRNSEACLSYFYNVPGWTFLAWHGSLKIVLGSRIRYLIFSQTVIVHLC